MSDDPEDQEEEVLRRIKAFDVPAQQLKTLEERYFELREKLTEAEISGIQQDIQERKKYAHRIFCLISVWLVLIFYILILQGFGGTHFFATFYLSEKVILALIGSTTLNVLAIFVIVTYYLFPKK